MAARTSARPANAPACPIERIYVLCHAGDVWLAKISVASIRYWYADVPVTLIKDRTLGDFNTAEMERCWKTSSIMLANDRCGLGFAKIELLLRSVRERFLVVDADTVMCGPVLRQLEQFPEDFRQGMDARAGLLGDVRNNHPRRWRLPLRFAGVDAPPHGQAIGLAAVHAVLQLRCRHDGGADAPLYWDGSHPLHAELRALHGTAPAGVRILAVESARARTRGQGGQQATVEHFGYVDGIAQRSFLSFGDQRIQLVEKRRERLARAGWREDERVITTRDRRPSR